MSCSAHRYRGNQEEVPKCKSPGCVKLTKPRRVYLRDQFPRSFFTIWRRNLNFAFFDFLTLFRNSSFIRIRGVGIYLSAHFFGANRNPQFGLKREHGIKTHKSQIISLIHDSRKLFWRYSSLRVGHVRLTFLSSD